MQKYSNYFLSNSDQILNMVQNSGKDYNDFGRFQECESMPDFNYLLCEFDKGNQLPIPMNIGICIPSVCNAIDINELKPYFIPVLNQHIPMMFETTHGFNLSHLRFESGDIHFVNSIEQNKKVTSFQGYTACFLTLLLTLVIFALASTIVQNQAHKRKKQLAIQRKQRMKMGLSQPEPIAHPERRDEDRTETYSTSSKFKALIKSKRCIKNKKLFGRFLKQFSLKLNMARLFSSRKYDKDDSELEIFNCLKVVSILFIVLGNTYFYILGGPIQNLEIVSQLFRTTFFMFVFQADIQCDVFYWITGFITGFTILKQIRKNEGTWWAHPSRIFFGRVFRLLPLYFFMIFFLWKFINIFGGSGPRFY